MSRKAGVSLNQSGKALTRAQKRIKVLRALRLRKENLAWPMVAKRCGNTEVRVLRQWAEMLGIPWPENDLRYAKDRTTQTEEDQGLQPWQQEFAGFYWHQMPGGTVEDQKLNFALYRYGQLEVDEVTVDLEDGSSMILATNARDLTQKIGRKVFFMPTQEEGLVGLQRRAAMSRRVEGGAA